MLKLVFFVLPPCAQIAIFCASSLCSNCGPHLWFLVLNLVFFVLPPCAKIAIFCASSLCSFWAVLVQLLN